jgi:exosortase D (VPLPA-CTERM-specific)
MVGNWDDPQYSHGSMIPIVAFYLFWLRAKELSALNPAGSWLGILLLAFGLGMQVLGSLSAVGEIPMYGFVISIWGLALAAIGLVGLRVLWVPLVYLLFMVPLADFLESRLTFGMQLLSSQIGVAMIRLVGISVFLQGNVIDLGTYKLQVAEACSGMRYLFPLMSFGFLCAMLFRGQWWQRAIIFLSTVPITLLMNSFRIGIIGILVNYFGIEMAEGFLHLFEGWVVFMICVLILFLEIWIFARLEKQGFLKIFGLDMPALADLTGLLGRARPNPQILTAIVILIMAAIASLTVTRPPTLIPVHESLQRFPLRIGEWVGREGVLDQEMLDAVKATDYTLSTYIRPSDPAPVAVWIAYYEAQAQGAGVHSPQSCLPGGGWQIESLQEYEVPQVRADGGSLRVNRVVIALGDLRQVVYYWFAQRGRVLQNEFVVKWFILWDGITMNRTDGALVRIATPVDDVSRMAEADLRLQAFLRDADPKLNYYLPGASAPVEVAAPAP